MHIAIEGQLGSGKSTFCENLQKILAAKGEIIDIFPEPVEVWSAYGENSINLLDLMYKDPKNFAFKFQVMAATTKVQSLKNLGKNPISVVERTLHAQEKVFLPLLKSEGMITELENQLVKDVIQLLKKQAETVPDLIIYLRISPEKALERIRTRGRTEEAGLSLEYLTSVHNLYEIWLRNCVEIPVMIVEAGGQVDLEHVFRQVFQKYNMK